MPFKEDLAVNTPISPYAATKKAAEVMAYTYHRQYNIDVSINQFIQWIEQLTGKKARINHQPVHS
ncbi:MAG: NAD-dependent epimerase/dehydratase family protein, partial [Prolixibacteraceae bacterium]|nr:NAD-dependent epimerase/dehydratase family protein [Prolixibacteraceae bacterium]